MRKGNECHGAQATAVLNVGLREPRLLDERVQMEGIGEGYEDIEDYHVVCIARKPEGEDHKGIDRYSVWRQCDG